MQGPDQARHHELLRRAVEARALAERDLAVEASARLTAERELADIQISAPPLRRLLARVVGSRPWYGLTRAVQWARRDSWATRSYADEANGGSVRDEDVRLELLSEGARRRQAESAWRAERRQRSRADWRARALRGRDPAPRRARPGAAGVARSDRRPSPAELRRRLAQSAGAPEPLRINVTGTGRGALEEAARALGWALVEAPEAEVVLALENDARTLRVDSVLKGERQPALTDCAFRHGRRPKCCRRGRADRGRPTLVVVKGCAPCLEAARRGGDYLRALGLSGPSAGAATRRQSSRRTTRRS